MSQKAHAELQASLDDSRVQKAIKAMGQDISAFARGASKEFQMLDKANARFAQGLEQSRIGKHAGAEASWLRANAIGQGAMGLAGVARSAKNVNEVAGQLAQSAGAMGALLGPTGLIVGGIVAMGGALMENKRIQDEIVQSAKDEARVRERTAQIVGRQNAARRDANIQKETESIQRQIKLGDKAAASEERRLQAKEDIAKIEKRTDLPDDVKQGMIQNRIDRFRAGESLIGKRESRAHNEQELVKQGRGIMDRARESMLPASERDAARHEARAFERAQRSIINKDIDAADRAIRNRSPFDRSEIDKSRRGSGLSNEERSRMITDRREALKAAKDPKSMVNLSDESINKIVGAIHDLIAK